MVLACLVVFNSSSSLSVTQTSLKNKIKYCSKKGLCIRSYIYAFSSKSYIFRATTLLLGSSQTCKHLKKSPHDYHSPTVPYHGHRPSPLRSETTVRFPHRELVFLNDFFSFFMNSFSRLHSEGLMLRRREEKINRIRVFVAF